MSWTRTSPGFPRFATPTSTGWAATASVLVRPTGRWGFLAYLDSTRPMGSESAVSASHAACRAGSSGGNALRR